VSIRPELVRHVEPKTSLFVYMLVSLCGAPQETGQDAGADNTHLVIEGDDRCLIEVGAPYKDGGVHLAALGRDATRRVKIEGERRLLCDDAGGKCGASGRRSDHRPRAEKRQETGKE
jgi:hypothetical protein